MAIETYHVHRRSDQSAVGSVSATSEMEAVFRLIGGEYGRTDYYAVSEESRRYHREAARRGHFVAAPYERD